MLPGHAFDLGLGIPVMDPCFMMFHHRSICMVEISPDIVCTGAAAPSNFDDVEFNPGA